MKSVSPQQLNEWITNKVAHQLIDIRESYEIETCSIGGMSIPMADILSRTNEIRKDVPVVIHCKSGKRSSAVIHSLEQKFGLTNLYTLEGGIIGWIEAIDQELTKY